MWKRKVPWSGHTMTALAATFTFGACMIGLPTGAQAQSKSDLDDIRQQIQDLKGAYESRIQALEKRLKDAEQATAAAQSTATEAQAKAETSRPEPAAAKQSSQNAFNPAISLILMGQYGNFKQDPTQYSITGFQPPGATSPGTRGFSIG